MPEHERARRAEINKIDRQRLAQSHQQGQQPSWFDWLESNLDVTGWSTSDASFPLRPDVFQTLAPDDVDSTELGKSSRGAWRNEVNLLCPDDGALQNVRINYEHPCHLRGFCAHSAGALNANMHVFCEQLNRVVWSIGKRAVSLSEAFLAFRGRRGGVVREVYFVLNYATYAAEWGCKGPTAYRQMLTLCVRTPPHAGVALDPYIDSFQFVEPPWILQLRRIGDSQLDLGKQLSHWMNTEIAFALLRDGGSSFDWTVHLLRHSLVDIEREAVEGYGDGCLLHSAALVAEHGWNPDHDIADLAIEECGVCEVDTQEDVCHRAVMQSVAMEAEAVGAEVSAGDACFRGGDINYEPDDDDNTKPNTASHLEWVCGDRGEPVGELRMIFVASVPHVGARCSQHGRHCARALSLYDFSYESAMELSRRWLLQGLAITPKNAEGAKRHKKLPRPRKPSATHAPAHPSASSSVAAVDS